jgi:hypothetical protein
MRPRVQTGCVRRGKASSRGGLFGLPHRFMEEWATSTPRSAMRASTWRMLRGYATAQRTPLTMTSGGTWAPGTLIALGALPHDALWLSEEEDTSKHLKSKLRQNRRRSLRWDVTS